MQSRLNLVPFQEICYYVHTMNFKAVKTCLLFACYTCRIFQFEDFKRTKKRVLEEEETDGAMVKKSAVLVII